MNYNRLLKELEKISDKRFAEFSKSLQNSDYIVIGVQNPKLRELIKLYKDDEELKLDDFILGEYLEIDFIYFGLALSRLKRIDDQLDFLINNIKYAKSWVITDCVTTFIKKCDFDSFWSFFLKLYYTKYTYERRMAYVLGLKHYKDKRILQILKYINKNEEYMVMMAEAWLLATIAIDYSDEIYQFLFDLDDINLKRKTISKMCDSRRIDEETKNKFKLLR